MEQPNALVLKLVINGEVIPSKKNSKVTFWSKVHKRPFVVPSNKYTAWEATAKKIAAVWAIEMRNKHGIQFPLKKAACKILFYWKNNRALDNTNKAESIHDMLIKANIIADDKWQVLNPTSQESRPCVSTPRVEVYLSNFQ